MGIRNRKNLLITVLKARALATKMKPEEVAQFELMYRRARDEHEQDQVTAVLHQFLFGWKDGGDAYSKLLQTANDFDDLFEDDEDRLPPALEAAIARVRVTL